MKGSSIFLLLFGIILFGLAYYFLQYSFEEGFQSAGVTSIFESDKFLSDNLNPQVIDVRGYSNAYKIKENFTKFFSDWHNYSGYTLLRNIYPERRSYDVPFQGVTEAEVTVNLPTVIYNYIDYDGNPRSENLTGKDILLTVDIGGNSATNIHHYFPVSLYFNGIRRGPLMEDSLLESWEGPGIYGARTITVADLAGNGTTQYRSYNFSPNTFLGNFERFTSAVAKNIIRNKLTFAQNLKLWDPTNIVSRYANPNLYSIAAENRTPVLFSITNFKTNDTGFGQTIHTYDVSYDIGAFTTADFPSQAVYSEAAQNEKIRLNVYGSFCNYHLKDFEECIHWGSVFDFSDINLLDIYLNVSYDDIYFNGSNVWYSYGLFYPDVKPTATKSYISNTVTFKHNTLLKGAFAPSEFTYLPTDYIADIPNFNTTAQYSGEFINNIIYTNYRYGENYTNSYDPNGTKVRRLGLTGTDYNNFYIINNWLVTSNTTLEQRYVGIINRKMISKMPIMMRRYITSWTYNRSQRLIDVRLSDTTALPYNINKAAFLLTLAKNNLTKSIADSNSSLSNVWFEYLNKYLSNGIVSSNIIDNYIHGTANVVSQLNNSLAPVDVNPYFYAFATVALHGGKPSGFDYGKTSKRFWGRPSTQSQTATTVNSDARYCSINYTTNPNLIYKTTGDTWDLNDDTMAFMISDFKGNMSKLLPDYGFAANINILDNKMLDSVAQSFYEYSDGLFEITFIYDLYLIGSNMMDIRFDKKQRLASSNYVTLRNQYIPQINAYNRLLDMYNNGTWTETYSNIIDLQSNISTSLNALNPVLNPIYTKNNANPDTLRAQINALNASNITLRTQINSASMSSAEQLKAAGSNEILLSNLLKSGGSANNSAVNAAFLQSQYDDNDNTIARLTNQIDGIETNVARIFFTMTNSSNLIVNGLALGPNAALTYNKVYNASLEVDMGQSLGNVNYSPTIMYTKNIIPVINPSNINFIKQAAQLYMDGITTTLSSFTSNTFQNSNGIVRVDRVYGFTKLDDVTCGFTWQESQYDFYTNKPNVQRIVDVALKFAFDNIEYQNPQIYIDNKVSNIYLNISNEEVQTQISNLQNSNTQIMTMFSNYLLSNTIYLLSNYRMIYFRMSGVNATNGTPCNIYKTFSNAFYTNSNAALIFNSLFSSNFNFNNISNFFNIIDTLSNGPSSNLINYPENSPISLLPNFSLGGPVVDYGYYIHDAVTAANMYSADNKICYISNSYPSKITFGDGSITDINLRDSPSNLFTQDDSCTNRIGSTWVKNRTDTVDQILNPYTKVTILYPRNVSMPRSKVENYSIDYKTLLSRYIYNSNLLNQGITGEFSFNILQNSNEQPFTMDDYMNNYKGEVYYPPFENLLNNYTAQLQLTSTINSLTAISVPVVTNRYNINLHQILTSNIPNTIPPVVSDFFRTNTDWSFAVNLAIRNMPQNYKNIIDTTKRFYTQLETNVNSNINVAEEKMTATNVSNAYVIIPWQPQEEETLDNNDGACPANIVCGSPQVMKQLMDNYNLDSNNDDKIVRILKAFTPNSFQCDYSVEISDSNRRTKKGTISFQVAQNIEDCSYVIASNSGFNTGYYILDKVKNVRDSTTDISGYQYVNESLVAFGNSVKTLFNPLITSASNSANDMYKAFASSRLLTYTSLGKLNVLSNIGTCGNIDYNKIKSLLYNDKRFLYSIFQTYPYFDSHMNTIMRIGLRQDNMLEVVFERLNLSPISNLIITISKDTVGALYAINQDTSNYCSFVTNFVRLTTPSLPSMISNISMSLPATNYDSNNLPVTDLAHIYNDLNIMNPMPIQKIDPVNKRTIQLFLNGVGETINTIVSYTIWNTYSVIYNTIVPPYRSPYSAAQVINKSFICRFTKSTQFNIFNITNINIYDPGITGALTYYNNAYTNVNSIYNINTYIPIENLYRTTISKNITAIPNNFIMNSVIDFGNLYLQNLTGLPNISAYKINPTDINTCEYYLGLENIYLPIEKRFFKVKYYTDDWLNATSSNVAMYSIIPATVNNSLYSINITGIDTTSLINIFKTYYESVNTNAIIADIHSVDSIVGNSLIANVSIIYVDSNNNIINNMIPNIKAFNNDKFFKIYYRQEPQLTWNASTAYNKNNVVLYNSLYYTAKFNNTNILPTNVSQGELYWGTGSSSNPILIYTHEEVNRLSNPTSFTYANLITIPTKNNYIDILSWNYLKFNPISIPQLSQFEFYKDNVKLNVYVKPIVINGSYVPNYVGLPGNPSFNTYSNSYDALFNYNNVNTNDRSNIKSIDARITMALVYPTNFNGFSITTGRFKTILNWSLDASIDGSNWVTLMNAPQPYFEPRKTFNRSLLYNFKDGATNMILPQNPYYGVTLYDCAIQLNITPISPVITNLYNTYSISAFNNDISSLFQNNPTITAFQNLELVYYLADYDNNSIYHILKTLNTKTNTYVYLLYILSGFSFSASCENFSGDTPELYGLIPDAEAQKLIAGTPRAACGSKPTIRTIVDSYTYNYAPWWRKAEYDQELAIRLRTWEICSVIGSNFTVITPPITVLTGTTPLVFNADKFCTNYSNNDLAIITSNYIGGAVPVRFDTSYIITHKKVDRATNNYSYILSNIKYRKIYKYDNTDEEGIIYYTDSLPLNTMIQNYTTSNIITEPNDLPYTTLGPCELILTITGSNYTILECAEYMDMLVFSDSSNYTATLTPMNTSVTSYAASNNFIFMTTSLSNSIYAGTSNLLIQQFNRYDSISNIKNNCGLNYTNQDILQLSQEIPLLDGDGNPVTDANGKPIYTFSYGSIFNGDIIITLSNTYNFSLTSDTEPYITYGKKDLNDSLKYNYIVCIPGTDTSTSLDKAMYAEYSIKFYYGPHSNRNYSNYTFITNGGQDACTINTTITFQNLHTPVNIVTYSATANYEPLGRMVQYNICSSYINTRYRGLSDFATTPSVSPVGFYDSTTETTNNPSFYYSKLAYTRDRINPYFKKDFVYACYIMGDFKNPLFLEYNIKINSITNCSNIDFSFNYKRILTVAQFNNLSNQNYIKYNDPTNFNNRQQLSNCGINYNYMLSNFIVDNVSYSPTNINFSMIQSLVYPNLENLDIDLENIESKTLAYTKYDYKDGISIFSYILNLDGRTLTDDTPTTHTIDYSIYIFYNSSNCETLISGIQINNSNITTNISQYVTSNNYIANSVGLTQSQLMLANGLNARTPVFINTVNSALSNLKNNATYQNNIFTIQYIYTDYTSLQNKYIAAYWSPDTPITLNGLLGASRLGYLEYTITLSNILSSTDYSYSLNSIPNVRAADENFENTLWSNGMTGKFYKNGVITNTNITELAYNATTCFNYYSASNSDIVNFIFSGLDVNQFTVTLNGDAVDLTEGTGLPLGIYAYKKTLSNFSYILHYKPASINYYPIIQISLGNASDFEPTSCTNFFTTITSPDGTSVVNVTYVSGSIPTATRSAYASANGYTINYILNVPSDGFQDYNPSESFADYHIRDPIKKNIETYSYLSLTATNNFRVNGFTLYTMKDSEVSATLLKTDVNSIIVQNIRNSVILGYSFITNSISPEYDPKEWILKGTNDGRNWTTLDSRKLGKALPRNYQMPLLYLNGRSKLLPQPLSRLEERVLEQDSSIDKSILTKYYKQRINPSVIPDYKKFMYDKTNKVHYFLHDSYDLNKNLIGKNLIIGFVLQDDKVKKPILYENEDGTQVSFDMTKKHMKQFWEKNIMLPLVFQDF